MSCSFNPYTQVSTTALQQGRLNNLMNALRATAKSHRVMLTSRCLEAQLRLHFITESAIFVLHLLRVSLS